MERPASVEPPPLCSIGAAGKKKRKSRQLEDRLRAGTRWHDGAMCSSKIGTALDARNVVRRYHVIREGAGLPNLPWHHLRHFAATALLEAGEDLFVVSRILGHISIATTASFYGHVRPAMLRRSADRMNELLGHTSAG